jgi:hypothetical protein
MRRLMVLAAIATGALVVLFGAPGCGGDSGPSLDEFAGWWYYRMTPPMQLVVADDALAFGPYSTLPPGGSIEVDGRKLVLRVDGARFDLALSGDGKRLSGTLHSAGQVYPVTYRRQTEAQYKMLLVNRNEATLADWLQQWRDEQGEFPAAREMTPDGAFGQRFQPWPLNPYTDEPMHRGKQPGDYRYTRTSDGYSLDLYEPDGRQIGRSFP